MIILRIIKFVDLKIRITFFVIILFSVLCYITYLINYRINSPFRPIRNATTNVIALLLENRSNNRHSNSKTYNTTSNRPTKESGTTSKPKKSNKSDDDYYGFWLGTLIFVIHTEHANNIFRSLLGAQ